MSPESRSIAIRGGCLVLVASIGFAWVWVRSGTISDLREERQRLEKELSTNSALGTDSQLAQAKALAGSTNAAASRIESQLIPELPAEYLASDLTSAAAQVSTDLTAIRQRAERQGLELPGALPFEGGLDANELVRQQQLTQLHLLRSTCELLFDAPVRRISALTMAPTWGDPTGRYATFSMNVEGEGDHKTVLAAVRLLRSAQGLGISGMELTNINDGKALRLKATVALLVRQREGWNIAASKAVVRPAATPAPTSASSVTPKRGL